MSATQTDSVRRAAAIGLALAAGMLLASAAWAQPRHEGRGHEVHEAYRTPHLIYDNRYRHGHYYPVVGYSVGVLPPGYLSIGFGARRFFFHGGVWYATGTGGYVVVRPPLGVIVPVLPPAYTMVWAGGAPYYYANDVYYTEAPGGYAVAQPPGEVAMVAPPAPQPMPPAPQPMPPAPQPMLQASAPPQPAAPMWHYCESSKSYYPYVAECKEGWRAVPATPQPPR